MSLSKDPDWEERQYATRRVVKFEWKIDNYLTVRSTLEDRVDSQPFPTDRLPQWYIQLWPRGKQNSKPSRNGSICLMLKKAEWDQTAVADYYVKLVNDDRSVMTEYSFSREKFVEENSSDAVWEELDSTELSTLGHLIIQVELTVHEKAISMKLPFQIPKSSATENLKKLFLSGELADFEIESGDDRHFPVHKCILASQVEVFSRMFDSKIVETTNNQLKLPEVKGDIVAALLEFIYTDDVVNLSAVASELIKVAHQYMMDRLTCMCVAAMFSTLTAKNISAALNTAKLYKIDSLLSGCEKFLKDHPTVAIQMVLNGETQAKVVNTSEEPK